MRIAMIGQKGVPATFGGPENHVEEIGWRLADRGHEVTVFCRPNYVKDKRAEYRGMRLRHLPTVGTKHLDAIVHSAFSSAATVLRPVDVVHYHTIGPGLLAPLPRYMTRAKVALTVHGLDGEREKWGRGAATVLRGAEWMSARVPDVTIVVSNDLARHYAERYGRRTRYIPNGAKAPTPRPAREITDRFGLEAGRYVLFVGRVVPEKAPDLLVRAFGRVETDLRLAVAGGSAFTDEYHAAVARAAAGDRRVVLTGYAHGPTLEELYSNAAVLVLPSNLEGLPLVLLEGASYGVPVITSDIPPHLEVVGGDGAGHRLFPAGDEQALARVLGEVLDDLDGERAGAADLARRVQATYRWDDVVDQLERTYAELLER